MRYLVILLGPSDSTNEKSINIMQEENEFNLDFSRHMVDDVGCVKCGWPLCSERCPMLTVHRTAECTHLAKYRQPFFNLLFIIVVVDDIDQASLHLVNLSWTFLYCGYHS